MQRRHPATLLGSLCFCRSQGKFTEALQGICGQGLFVVFSSCLCVFLGGGLWRGSWCVPGVLWVCSWYVIGVFLVCSWCDLGVFVVCYLCDRRVIVVGA